MQIGKRVAAAGVVVVGINHRLCKQNKCFVSVDGLFWQESSAFSAFTGCIFRNDTGRKLHATGDLVRVCSHFLRDGGGEGCRLKVSLPLRWRVMLPL